MAKVRVHDLVGTNIAFFDENNIVKSMKIIAIALLSITVILTSCGRGRHTRYVDPFIGAAEFGHTFPGACVPFGMIQAGPQTGNCNWAYTAGYQYVDTLLDGFSQTRLNGTGVPDLGDILLMPLTADEYPKGYRAVMDKNSEVSRPGYYSVTLKDSAIEVEITSTRHVAMHRYHYPAGSRQNLIVDFQSGLVVNDERRADRVIDCRIEFVGDRHITGYMRCKAWLEREYYFQIEFDRDITSVTELEKQHPRERAPRYMLGFGNEEGVLQVKISISVTDEGGAEGNILAELPGWDFKSTAATTQELWEQFLGGINIKGTPEQKIIFYTALYHLYIQPNNIADAGERPFYSTLSLWDTYRAAHPLYTILCPDMAGEFVASLLRQYDRQGFLPIWALWGGETYCMIGNHAVPVIVDACMKGVEGFDRDKAYSAVKRSLTENHRNSDWELYDRYGYYPCDMVPREAVSRTLESVYDDYCAMLLAGATGNEHDREFFGHRAGYYKNLFDPSTGFMRGRDSHGNWREPFDPFDLGHTPDTAAGDYTEGNSWQYTWHVQHDIQGLIELLGGLDRFCGKLDSLFTFGEEHGRGHGSVLDVTGHIGQYAHGNEPSHHVAYLYALAGKPWRTQELIRRIVETKYLNRVDGLCGNEDCGQMSAWYIFSCMGFYPVNPCGGEYIFGAPQIEAMDVRLPAGKTLCIRARNLSAKNKYVESITLNGKTISRRHITHREIMNGGTLVYQMGSNPCDYTLN
jgi:predicted alpha-1,2-mannosidase